MTREGLIKKMQDEFDRNGKYINCRLAVQLTTGVSKLEDLPRVEFKEIQLGDVLAWGFRHFAIWLGDGQILQVGGWGEPVTTEAYTSVLEYWDEPTEIYRPERVQ